MKLTNVFLKYCLKYFVAFIIILACCIPIVSVSNKIVKQQIIETNQLKLREGISEIDQNISKMNLITKSMKQDYHFKMLINTKGVLNRNEYMWLEYSRQKVENTSLIYTFPVYSFLLFKENDLYISPNQSSDVFYNYYGKFLKIIDNKALNSKEFKEELFMTQGLYAYKKVNEIRFIANGKENSVTDAILCSVKGTSDYTNSASHIMTYVITPDALVKFLLTEDTRADGLIKIEDSKTGEILLEYGKNAVLLGNVNNGEEINVNGTVFFLSSYETEEAGWKVTIGIPKSIVDNQIKSITNIIQLYICLGMIIVLFLTFYFSYRQYINVRKLFITIYGEGGTLSKGQNEYDVLRGVFKDITRNKDEFKNQMENLNQQYQALMLENLIVRGINTREEHEEFEKCFAKPLEYFCVVLLRMQIADQSMHQFALLCIMEYLKESYPSDFSNVHTGIRDELFLFALNPEDSSNVKNIKNIFESFIMVLSEDFDTTIHVGISAIGTEISNINICYNQAQQVIQAYFNESVNCVEEYNININSVKENIIGVEYLNKLYNLILCGEQEAIVQQFTKIFAYYQKMTFQYEVQKQQIFFSIRNVIYSAYLHLITNPNGVDILPEYKYSYTLEEMLEVLRISALEVCNYMEEKKKSKNMELKENIVAYINNNYMDTSITAAKVSNEMRIAEKYLSQFMKEHTGETFTSYLEQLRINKAKEYLASSDMSNEKIAELTGFGAINTFYRTFNKRTGVSPGTYRSSNQEK
ncbi:MAG: helix-turn-helix domain-containing protein [Anaerocolumna sp.]